MIPSPRPQQLAVLEMLFAHGHKRIIILKARQIGFSTLLGVDAAISFASTLGSK